jgi:hypothetical protein
MYIAKRSQYVQDTLISAASLISADPASHPVGNVPDIRRSGSKSVVQIVPINAPRVVVPRSLVDVAVDVNALRDAVARRRALGPVHDHLHDAGLGVVGVVGAPGVALHQARVGVGALARRGGGADPDAANGLLHDGGEDVAMVDERGLGDLLDGAVYLVDLARNV